MPEPAVLLAGAMAASLVAYALLGGADYGGGLWDLLARGPTASTQRATIARAIAPVWEANHVWLILVVTVMFAAFPSAFAWMGTHLHVPLAVALIGIVLRGSAFVFRVYGPPGDPLTRSWGFVFAVSSVLTPALLGVALGAMTEGSPTAAGATEPWFWLTPFTASVGVFGLVLCAFLASVYLTLEAQSDTLAEAFRRRALVSGVLTGLLALVVFLLAGRADHLQAMLTTSRIAMPLHAATAVAATGALVLLWRRRYWWARAAAIVQVSLIVVGWAAAQYPYLIRPHLTIDGSAGPRATLVLMVWILGIGAVVLIPSLVFLFRLFSPVRPRPD
jgi:cytochrome d ubiquinol oxidase subunit II